MDWQTWLSERPIAVIATTGPDGMPHAVPVEVVVHGGKVYTWGHAGSARAANLQRDARAALVAYKGNAYVMVRGPVRLIRAGEARYDEITTMFLQKYRRTETYGNDLLAELTPERVSARID